MSTQVRRRCIAWSLLLTMIAQCGMPLSVMALTSGPSQPEVQGFTPAGDPQVVDLFTGDASYNIPIMDVEGYPINLAYKAGSGMDQEASWVGLGWSLGAGQVERSVRGLPDDFNGDLITREMNLRPNKTLGFNMGLSLELFGQQMTPSPWSLSLSANPSFNNQDGARFDMGATIAMRSTTQAKSGMNGSLGVSASSEGSLTMQPGIGFDKEFKASQGWAKGGLNFGMALNSKDGLQDMSFGASVMRGQSGRRGNTSRFANASFDFTNTTYTPEVSIPMENYSVSARISGGIAFVGTNTGGSFGAFYSRQRLATQYSSRRAYGYINLDNGENDRMGLLDFSREKDGPFTGKQTFLPVSSLSNDFFSVSAQNMSGSFRPFRTSVGHVFDAQNSCTGSGGSAGYEAAGGGLAHFGGDIVINEQSTVSGDWVSNAPANNALRFGYSGGLLPEKVCFREANEAVVDRDPAQFDAFGGSAAQRLELAEIGGYNAAVLPRFDGSSAFLPSQSGATARQPRGTVFSYLNDGEVSDGLGLEGLHDRTTSGLMPVNPADDPIPNHHISEICVTGKEGQRNFFALPAYNIEQSDVSFALPMPANDGIADSDNDYDAAVVPYGTQDNSMSNTNGKDYFYSKNTTPRHAYAYLLTAAVSADYSDVDGVRGPSNGDLGSWTRFKYDLVDGDYHWRTPVAPGLASNRATPQPGLAYAKDDRATYSYGRKEVWALRAIEGRNLVAIFFSSPRLDAHGINENGTENATDVQVKLDSVALYSKDLLSIALANNAPLAQWPTPIKTAHFDYDYSLCPNTPNAHVLGQPDQHVGKLTLKRVYFTFGKSRRGETSPYQFTYGKDLAGANEINPEYEVTCQDRWGGLRPDKHSALATLLGFTGPESAALPFVKDFPYALQDKVKADRLARAWCLTKVQLPSGGELLIAYESDDYGYVQNKAADMMVQVTGVSNTATGPTATLPWALANYIRFKVPTGTSASDVASMFSGSGPFYFRFKVDLFGEGLHDYVSGYAELATDAEPGESGNQSPTGVITSGGITEGYVAFKRVHIDQDDVDGPVHPIHRSAIEFGRLNYPDRVFLADPSLYYDGDEEPGTDLIMAMASSALTLLTAWDDFVQGPNASIRDNNPSIGQSIDYGASYLRVRCPGEGHLKLGGGHRVSAVYQTDGWSQMTSGDEPGMAYGTTYTYQTTDGTTSGVAAYEPMLGADENCLRVPVYNSVKQALTPDQRFYQEYPFAESLYPSPVVGYSRVVVADALLNGTIPPEQSKGHTEHIFHTARDFPVIANRTSIDDQHYKPAGFNLLSLLGFKTKDHRHVSQGFVVETNDMHGKPWKKAVYPQGSADPLSTEEYVYATDQNGTHLSNRAEVIEPDGSHHPAEIGRHYEFIADLRSFTSDATSAGVALNNEIVLLIAPVNVFIPWPKFSSESTRFKSATFVKKIHRFALTKEIIRTESGRTVTTSNEAYDALTGNVLITKVLNDFKDPVFSTTLPAYWYHDGMGPAYQNINAVIGPLTIGSQGTATGLVDINRKFVVGDEVSYWATGSATRKKAWVENVTTTSVRFIDQLGNSILLGPKFFKILRSGRRNMPSVPMTTMTTLSDPLPGLQANVFNALVNVNVAEFGQEWTTNCDCVTSGQSQPTTNPFILGTRGIWRLHKEHAWLTERSRSTENHNANIRRDGVYGSFDPFYKLVNQKWTKDGVGWVATREVTAYTMNGQEMENLDALGIASSATFGMRGTLVKSVAKNALYREQGFDDFEDPVPYHCGDRHFRFEGGRTDVAAHSGRYSMRVVQEPVVLQVQLVRQCDDCGCTFALGINEGDGVSVVSENAALPISWEPVVLDGDVITSPSTNGDTAALTGTGTVAIHAVDANGCTDVITVTIPIP